MLLSKISINNFKSFDDIDIDFGKINVVVGANASGKSNLIQAIKFIKDIEDMGIEDAVSMQGGIDFLMNMQTKEKKSCTIAIELTPIDGSAIEFIPSWVPFLALRYSKVKYLIEIKKKSAQKIEIVREELTYHVTIDELGFENQTDVNSLFSYIYTIKVKKGKLSQSNTLDKKNLTVTLRNGQGHTIKEELLSPLFMSFDVIEIKWDKSESLIKQFSLLSHKSLDFFVYDFDIKNAKKPGNITAKSSLEEDGANLAIVLKRIMADKEEGRKLTNLMQEVLPFINDIRVEKLSDTSLLFKVKEKYNQNAILPSSLLSDGTIAVTSLIVAMFFEKRELIIFEEPEKSIHPAIISKIMNLFYDASNTKQILITTHNPEMVKYTKIEDLLLMTRSNNGFSSIVKPNEQESVHAFLKNDLGIDQLYIQNLLDI